MRRHVRALRQVADVAQVALVNHLGVIALGDSVDFSGTALVDQVEEGGKRIAQTDATTTAVADVKNAFEFSFQKQLVPEIWGFPGDRMARWRFEGTFTSGHDKLSRGSG